MLIMMFRATLFVQKCIMTGRKYGCKSWLYSRLRVRPLKFGIMYLHSLTMTETAITVSWSRRILIRNGIGTSGVCCAGCRFYFDVDTIKALRDHVCLAEKNTGRVQQWCLDPRHYRSCPFCDFMISDGIMPSNEGRGMFFAVCLEEPAVMKTSRHSQRIPAGALQKLSLVGSKDGYPELEEKKEFIFERDFKEEECSIKQ